MRIAILLSELMVEGGGDRQAVYLASELQDMGHDVVVYTPAYDRQRCYPDVCSRLNIVVTGKHPLTRLPIPSGRLRQYLNMRRLADRLDGPFDLLNPHHWPPHWAAVRAARRLCPQPAVVWMCNDPPWPSARPATGARRLLSPLRWLSRRAFLWYDRRAARHVSRIVVLSHYAKSLVDATFDSDCTVVRSGVSLDSLRLSDAQEAVAIRREHGIPAESFLLLSLGILMPHRRLEDALTGVAGAVARGYDIHYLVVGSPAQYPEYAGRLRSLAHDLGLDGRVSFVGAVADSRIKLYYHACDAFIFPNENQTWALAVTEAMACGKPVIVSRGAAVQEILEDGKTAFLVPPRRPDAIAEALRTVMDNPGLRDEVAENGRRLVAESLSWRRYAESMLGVFAECVAGECQVAATGEQPSAEAA